MGVTVREALGIGGFTKCKVVAGEAGLDREIEYITVMEVPDVIQWLKGNDLLLTSLYPIKDDPEAIRDLVRQLDEVNSSALAIKTQRYVQEIPRPIIEAGNRHNLPIIEIHNEVSYLDIMTPLMQIMVDPALSGKQELEAFFHWITELAMGGKGIPALVEAMQQMTDNLITVGSDIPGLDGLFKGRSIFPLSRLQRNELKAAKRSIRMERMLDGRLTPCIVTPLQLSDELYGDVTCWQTKRPLEERDFHLLDRAVPLLALEFLKVITRNDVEQAFKDDLLAEVLDGNVPDKAETIERARLYGWDLSVDYQVFAIAYAGGGQSQDNLESKELRLQEQKRKLVRKANEFFRFRGAGTIALARKEYLVILYPVTGGSENGLPEGADKSAVIQTAEAIRKQLSHDFGDWAFTVGIGRFYRGLEGIRQGYVEAVKAIRLGAPVAQEKGVVHFDDLGVFRILSQFHDWNELEDIYKETIGKLVEYDFSNNSNLVQTLTEYFACNCSLNETAEKLYVHVNTMKYRLQKIEQLTGHGIHDAEKRLLLHLGIHIHQILQTGHY
ncbi:PucR family transcriptional regulator [Cohnella massiliensis]|uniref:PucR family transcriptional regulator n=1 Tax=Cohnella massiliensis TaxID=1816691 RepID=UPI0009BBE4CD|nr:PucR family transcriptional regulator [Cohnella massiliensis]